MKRLIITIVFVGSLATAYGQAVINKNLYMANPVQINPAYMGSQGQLFVGFQSSLVGDNELELPTYTSVNVHGSFVDNLGVGMNVLAEKQGPFALTMADLGTSYRVYFTQNQSLAFGLNIGFIRSTLNASSFNTNPYVDQNDPLLNSEFFDETLIKLGAGFVYRYGQLELGVGSPYLFRGGESINEEANFSVSYNFAFSPDKFALQPLFLYQLKADDPDLYDINLRASYANRLWLLTGYRSNESINLGLGLTTPFFDFGYNYNSATGDLQEISANNHEILVAFKLAKTASDLAPQASTSTRDSPTGKTRRWKSK